MKSMHIGLGRMINGERIKAPPKSLLISMPSYDPFTFREIESGFCSSGDVRGVMAAHRILEPLSRTGSSGHGFPFTPRHLNFYMECTEAEIIPIDILEHLESRETIEYAKDVIGLPSRGTGNESIIGTAQKLKDVNTMFQGLRRAFGIPDHGKLSDEMGEIFQEMCSAFTGELDVLISQEIKDHHRRAAKLIIESYRNGNLGSLHRIVRERYRGRTTP